LSLRIGLISDTHGLVRPEALAALAGCDWLLHAGDIGRLDVLQALSAVAPVHAVRGNVDTGEGLAHLPERLDLELGGLRVHLVHRPQDIDEQSATRAALVVCGHTHRPLVDEIHGTLRVNPGSAGPRRFSLPVGVGIVEVRSRAPQPRLLTLAVPPARPRRRRGA
jgi:putative phosphoesterase